MRTGPNYLASSEDLDYFTFNECVGYWEDHCHGNAEYSYNTTDGKYPDGMGDHNYSNKGYISHCIFENGQRVMLFGYSDTDISNRGLLNTSIMYCLFRNNASRQPKCRFGKFDIVNCLFEWSPRWPDATVTPSSSNMLDLDAEAQILVRGTKFKGGSELRRDNDGSATKHQDLSSLIVMLKILHLQI